MLREQAGQVLAANLRALRGQAGLSLSELARRSGIAKGTLSQLESGTGNPTIETVFSLSKISPGSVNSGSSHITVRPSMKFVMGNQRNTTG